MAPLSSLDPFQVPAALTGASYDGAADAHTIDDDTFLGAFGTAALIAGSSEGAWGGVQSSATPSTVQRELKRERES